jgi:hypothetical protein
VILNSFRFLSADTLSNFAMSRIINRKLNDALPYAVTCKVSLSFRRRRHRGRSRHVSLSFFFLSSFFLFAPIRRDCRRPVPGNVASGKLEREYIARGSISPLCDSGRSCPGTQLRASSLVSGFALRAEDFCSAAGSRARRATQIRERTYSWKQTIRPRIPIGM